MTCDEQRAVISNEYCRQYSIYYLQGPDRPCRSKAPPQGTSFYLHNVFLTRRSPLSSHIVKHFWGIPLVRAVCLILLKPFLYLYIMNTIKTSFFGIDTTPRAQLYKEIDEIEKSLEEAKNKIIKLQADYDSLEEQKNELAVKLAGKTAKLKATEEELAQAERISKQMVAANIELKKQLNAVAPVNANPHPQTECKRKFHRGSRGRFVKKEPTAQVSE